MQHAGSNQSHKTRTRSASGLRPDQSRYRRLYEVMYDAFVSADMQGRFREANRAYQEMVGYTEAELRRMTRGDLTPERWHAFELGVVEKQVLQRGYSDVYEKEYRRKDGTIFPVEIRAFLLRDEAGEPAEVWAIARDITERKRTEDELRASRAFLGSIIEQSPTPTWISDSQGTLIRINRACCDLLHVTEAEILGKYNVFRDNLVETQGLAPLIRRVYEEHETVKFRIVWDAANLQGLRFADHAAVVLHTTVFPIRDETGNVTNAVFQHLDVTSLTQAELEKSRLETQLLQAQKMESIGRLAGGIAHDFNNMLSVIRGYAELLELQLPADGPYREQLAEIRKAAERSSEVTRQLLAFSRRQLIEPRVTDLNVLIGEMRGTLSRLIGEDVDLRVTAARELSRIRIDPTQINQLLVNLAANARDAMPKGGVLRVETSNVTLDEPYYREHPECSPGPYVELRVADTGVGMDAATQAQIFEPFFTTKEAGKGTGLGLATVYGIVRQNGGSIAVESSPGQGSTFRLLFPPTAAPAAPPSQEEPLQRAAGGIVLLVEDDDMVRGTTASMLEAAGFRVHAVGRPEAAVAFCADPTREIDLVLTDVVMQGMTGAEVRDRISRIRPEIPVLFMSGYTADAIAHRGVLSQGVELIRKPFSLQELARKVGEAISRKRGGRA